MGRVMGGDSPCLVLTSRVSHPRIGPVLTNATRFFFCFCFPDVEEQADNLELENSLLYPHSRPPISHHIPYH
jgi:hypothetical protein